MRPTYVGIACALVACSRAASPGVARRQETTAQTRSFSGVDASLPSDVDASVHDKTAPASSGEASVVSETIPQLPGVPLSDPDVRVSTSDANQVVVIPRQRSIPSCGGDKSVTVLEAPNKTLRIVRTSLDGRRRATLAAVDNSHGLSIDPSRAVGASTLGLLDMRTGAWSAPPGSERWRYTSIVPGSPYLIAGMAGAGDVIDRFGIVDYIQSKEVAAIEPDAAFGVSPDGAVFYTREGPTPKAGRCKSYVDVLRFHQGATEPVLRIVTHDCDSSLDVTEVVGRSREDFVYRVSEEHEHRYLWPDGTPFYSGGHGHMKTGADGGAGMGNAKEQYDLSFSGDRRFGAFAERNWNELTYLVLVDLERRRRLELPYYGSFPVVREGLLFFSSDPAFVLAKPLPHHEPTDGEAHEGLAFRQIASWALYAYDISRRSICRVGTYGYPIQAIP
jgi:hypothetical protein